MRKRLLSMLLSLLSQMPTTLLLEPTALGADGPPQKPAPLFQVEACRPYFTDADYQTLTTAIEIPEARQLFPASYLFVPPTPRGPEQHPGVVLLHGSEGGRWSDIGMCNARFLAANGYAALALCYSDCGVDALPEAVYRVDLQRTYDALAWLRHSPYVGGGKVALAGASRGAEQTLVLAAFLAKRAAVDPTLELPDAVFVHAPYGRIVGAFNWRWWLPAPANEWRWNAAVHANRHCLRDDPQGPYTYKMADGTVRTVAWRDEEPSCAAKPALAPDECWVVDPNGPYVEPDGTRYAWLTPLCGVAPAVDFDPFVIPAWTWSGSFDALPLGSDIALDTYPGPTLITHGALDAVWPLANGAEYLMATLARHRVDYHRMDVPLLTTPPRPLPEVPTDRVVFAVFAGEGHGFRIPARTAEWGLTLSFLARHLR